MTLQIKEAQKLAQEILEKLRVVGVDHYAITDEHKGNQRYLVLTVSFKVKD